MSLNNRLNDTMIVQKDNSSAKPSHTIKLHNSNRIKTFVPLSAASPILPINIRTPETNFETLRQCCTQTNSVTDCILAAFEILFFKWDPNLVIVVQKRHSFIGEVSSWVSVY